VFSFTESEPTWFVMPAVKDRGYALVWKYKTVASLKSARMVESEHMKNQTGLIFLDFQDDNEYFNI